MAPEYNTQIQSMMLQLQNSLNPLQSLSSTAMQALYQAGSSSGDASCINTIFSCLSDGQAIIEGSSEQKVQASVNIIENLLGMLAFSMNQVSKANQEVNNNANATAKNTKLAEQKQNELNQKINELTNNITGNSENIAAVIAEIEALGGDKGKLADIKLQIQAKIKEIEAAKNDLNDPDKRKEAIDRIKTAAKRINELVSELDQIKIELQAKTDVVNQNVDSIQEHLEQSVTVISNGKSDIQTLAQSDAKLAQEAAGITAQGATDIPTAKIEVKTGEAINSNLISTALSGGQGVKLILDGNQRDMAGQTRVAGGARNITQITLAIGGLGQNLSALTQYVNAIGQLGCEANNMVGLYNDAYISAIGTMNFDAIAAANTEFQTQVANLQSAEVKPTDDKKNNDGEQPLAPNDKKDEIDVQPLKSAFGI